MKTPELPPLPPYKPMRYTFDGCHYVDHEVFEEWKVETDRRERILLARVERLELTVQELGLRNAELDLALSIARQNAELLTGYWKAAVAEAKALRAEMKAHGITPEGDDDADGW